MSPQGMQGFRLAAASVLAVAEELTDKEWAAPSAAKGWTVQDVVTHIAELMSTLVAAVNGDLPEPAMPIGVEQMNDLAVASRANWTPDQTLKSFQNEFDRAETVFATLQEKPAATTVTPLLDLGEHPLHSIADMFAFDLTTHLYWDILAPRGPLTRVVSWPAEVQIAASLNWLMSGIPRMRAGLAASLTAPLNLAFTGPASRTVSVRPDGDSIVVEDGPATDAVATVVSTGFHALAWTTQRIPWRDHTHVTGDLAATQVFLDHLNLI
ncbi:maleylpyruvate isomerase N-terminal domain-containing protein [Streptomyces sp. NPDC059629]|uniref:maleylpyruvate isomerase N-terminal domain-containing protein n=1 Tax=Streptomyces sp. NPDC059629 TaxID=3346889 RepID=UPI0036AA0A02